MTALGILIAGMPVGASPPKNKYVDMRTKIMHALYRYTGEC